MNKKVYRLCAIVMVITSLSLSSCANSSQVPASSIPGYYQNGQTLGCGQNKATDVTLTDITVDRKQEEILITLIFAPDILPQYEVTSILDPSRIVLDLGTVQNLAAGIELTSMGEFSGMIAQQNATLQLYFNFTGQVAYKVQEENGKLILSVRADDAVSGETYHVRLPMGNQQSGQVLLDNEMLPALCKDAANSVYLTETQTDIHAADMLCNQINEQLSLANSDLTADVITLQKGTLPVYSAPVSRELLTMMGALKTANGLVDGKLMATDARFLCWTPKFDGLLMARPQTEKVEDGVMERYEEIWIYHANGKRDKLMEATFASVQKAAYSPDQRYIALLEQNEGTRMTYLYDIADGGLLFLSAEGFGEYTSDLDWGNDGRLYAMSGDETMQLMVYDPKAEQSGKPTISAFEERQGGYGNIACAGDSVYWADEDGDVYRVSAQGERELLTTANAFKLSPDGKYMALIAYDEENTETLSALSVLDMHSGQIHELSTGVSVTDIIWSGDSQALLYLTTNPQAENVLIYPVVLNRYLPTTGISEPLGMLASNSIFPGSTKDQFIVMFYQNRDDMHYPITYMLTLA